LPIFGEKNWRFFSKTNVLIKFLHNSALFRVKNAHFWRKYFKNHNIGPRLKKQDFCNFFRPSFRQLRAAASLHLHLGQLAKDHVVVLVHVEQVDAGHLLRGAAGAEVGLLDQVAVRVGGHDDAQAAVAGAEVGLVLGRVDDERPAVLLGPI
jgi:hypothetical protein